MGRIQINKHTDTISAMSDGSGAMENKKAGMGDGESEGWEG